MENTIELSSSEDNLAFFRLYEDVIDHFKNEHNISENDITNAINEIILLFHESSWALSRLDLNQYYNCCGLVRRFNACHAVMTRIVAENFLNHSTRILNPLPPCLNIVSVGGDIGNDLLGFTIGLRRAISLREPPQKLNDFKWTIIEPQENWEDFFNETTNIARNGNYEVITDLFNQCNINQNFIISDITTDNDTPNDEANIAIQNADIVLMVKLLSVIAPLDKVWIVLQAVWNEMKVNGIFLLVDTMSKVVKEELQETAEKYRMLKIFPDEDICDIPTNTLVLDNTLRPIDESSSHPLPRLISFQMYAAKKTSTVKQSEQDQKRSSSPEQDKECKALSSEQDEQGKALPSEQDGQAKSPTPQHGTKRKFPSSEQDEQGKALPSEQDGQAKSPTPQHGTKRKLSSSEQDEKDKAPSQEQDEQAKAPTPKQGTKKQSSII